MKTAIPLEFKNLDNSGERQDPEFRNLWPKGASAGSSATTRERWARWYCSRTDDCRDDCQQRPRGIGTGTWLDLQFFNKHIGGVASPAADAFRAMAQALGASGYEPRSAWAYNCRMISGTNNPSLHAYGVAIDIDPKDNPYSQGDPYSGRLQRAHVEAVKAIKNTKGQGVWAWGGDWSTPDRMHFQLQQGPDDVTVDWTTVASMQEPPSEGEANMLNKPDKGEAVRIFQLCLKAWTAEALPTYGADGQFGNETVYWVQQFQTAHSLQATGSIDGVTAALLIHYEYLS